MKYSIRLETKEVMLLTSTCSPFFSEMAAASIVGWLVKDLYELFVVLRGFDFLTGLTQHLLLSLR